MPTPKQQLATVLLKRDVLDYIRDYRNDGVSWRRIATNLHGDTKGRVDVSGETLRSWVPDDRG
jgi:hypothetical protein